VLGSIPGWLLIPVVVVLVTLRFASLILENTEPQTTSTENEKATPMAHMKSALSITAETAWALGTSMPAGLPLLT
jgi:hypothetical protein